jgi:hypothetical protein
LSDQSWKEVKVTIGAANDSRIQDSFGLKRIARLRIHHYPKALQPKSTHKTCLQELLFFA